ncbi:hypothetical protein, partial [Bacillus cereus group sp. BC60]|uniref:hypothetical protein n=1 Tax=Bacillus cereus group sp. BC60 TaxID=3445283 RepID=UPI003F23640C
KKKNNLLADENLKLQNHINEIDEEVKELREMVHMKPDEVPSEHEIALQDFILTGINRSKIDCFYDL